MQKKSLAWSYFSAAVEGGCFIILSWADVNILQFNNESMVSLRL